MRQCEEVQTKASHQQARLREANGCPVIRIGVRSAAHHEQALPSGAPFIHFIRAWVCPIVGAGLVCDTNHEKSLVRLSTTFPKLASSATTSHYLTLLSFRSRFPTDRLSSGPLVGVPTSNLAYSTTNSRGLSLLIPLPMPMAALCLRTLALRIRLCLQNQKRNSANQKLCSAHRICLILRKVTV